MREKYWEFDYEEVVTPNIFNFDLWKTSGHADHYRCATCTLCTMFVLMSHLVHACVLRACVLHISPRPPLVIGDREHMFLFAVEKAEFGLKPMNCPGR
jgi:threonyl-tRNA synthetase